MDSLTSILNQISKQSDPPVDQWDPEHCNDMDLVITRQGDWVHEGSVISRKKLVKLFSTILKREGDDYFLVTPVEKVGIKVENTPFVVVSTEIIDDRWFITNNLGDIREMTDDVRLDISDDQNPKLFWRRNLTARVNQNVMYQWQMHALDNNGLADGKLWLHNADAKHLLGTAD